MAEFNFYKFVVENKGTVAAKLAGKRLLNEADEDEFDSSEFEKEPSAKDIKATDKAVGGSGDKRTQLAQLTKKKDELIQKLKAGEITIDQYKQMIGTIPQQIKTITADLAKLTDVGDEEEEVVEASKSSLEEKTNWMDFFEVYDNTDLNGPGTEIAIDELINDYKQMIAKEIPEEDRYVARIAIKKLWQEKIANWKD